MSKLAIRAYYTDDPDMPHNAKMVLMALAEHHNMKTGLAWPSTATIAKHMKLSRRSAQRGLLWLKEHGYIKIAVPNRTGLETIKYRLIAEKLAPMPGGTSVTESPVSPCHNLVSGRRGTSVTLTPEPEREPEQETTRAGALGEPPASVEDEAREAADLLDLAREVGSCTPAELVEQAGGKAKLRELAALFGMPEKDIRRRLRQNSDEGFAYWVRSQAGAFLKRNSEADQLATGSQPADLLQVRKPDGTWASCDEVLEQLVAHGWLTPEEAEDLGKLPVQQRAHLLRDQVNLAILKGKEK
jgi:hypothetical protein